MPERSPSHTDSRLKTKRDRNLLCGHGLRWVSGLAGRGAQGHAGRDHPLCQPAAAQGVDSLLQQEGAEPTPHVETGWEDRMTLITQQRVYSPLFFHRVHSHIHTGNPADCYTNESFSQTRADSHGIYNLRIIALWKTPAVKWNSFPCTRAVFDIGAPSPHAGTIRRP